MPVGKNTYPTDPISTDFGGEHRAKSVPPKPHGFVTDGDGVVAEVSLKTRLPLSPLGSGDAFDLGGAECIEAVHECDADLDFCGLAVGVS